MDENERARDDERALTDDRLDELIGAADDLLSRDDGRVESESGFLGRALIRAIRPLCEALREERGKSADYFAGMKAAEGA